MSDRDDDEDVDTDMTPLDDRVLPEECECKFTPYPEEDDEEEESSWHYLRRCKRCGATWYALHCPHEIPDLECFDCFNDSIKIVGGKTITDVHKEAQDVREEERNYE